MKIQIPLLALTAIASTSICHAQDIFAGFDGTTDYSTYVHGNTGDTSVVDAWTGQAGSGWTSTWGSSNGSLPTSVEIQTINGTSPTGDTENYQQFRVTSTDDPNGRQYYHTRSFGDFGSVDLSQEVTFSFYYRADDRSASQIIDIKEGGTRSSDATTSWAIRSYSNAPTWWLGTGFGNNTGMNVVVGDNYLFTVTADPTTELWSVTIDNLDDTSGTIQDSVTATGLSFAGTNGGSLEGKFLTGGTTTGVASGTVSYNHSIDDITISGVVPEPSSYALIAGSMALGWIMLRRRK